MDEVCLQRSQEIGTLELLLKKVVYGGSYTLPQYGHSANLSMVMQEYWAYVH